MRKGIGGALGLTVVLGLSILTGPATAVGDEMAQPQRNVRPVVWCLGDTDTNCIESVDYQLDGEWRSAPVVQTIPDWGGKPIRVLSTPGLVHEGGRTQLVAEAFERFDIDGTVHPAYQVQIQSWPQGQIYWDPPINRCVNGDPSRPNGRDPCWRAPWLADAMYRITFRSDKLQPIFARSQMLDMETSYSPVGSGVRFSLAGRPGPSQFALNQEEAGRTDSFDAVNYEWESVISDARGANGLGAGCTDMGLISAYTNGYGGRVPDWNPRTGTLTFGTSGFHYDRDGKIYRGRAEITVPGALARCLWQVDPRLTARMEIEVFGEDGGEVAGTKTIAYDEKVDIVRLIAIDFTFSQKEVAARPTPMQIKPGKPICNDTKTKCVTVDRARKSAKVTLTRVKGVREIVAVAMRGNREEAAQFRAPVRRGKAVLSLPLSGGAAKDQVWILRSETTFISSFQVR